MFVEVEGHAAESMRSPTRISARERGRPPRCTTCEVSERRARRRRCAGPELGCDHDRSSWRTSRCARHAGQPLASGATAVAAARSPAVNCRAARRPVSKTCEALCPPGSLNSHARRRLDVRPCYYSRPAHVVIEMRRTCGEQQQQHGGRRPRRSAAGCWSTARVPGSSPGRAPPQSERDQRRRGQQQRLQRQPFERAQRSDLAQQPVGARSCRPAPARSTAAGRSARSARSRPASPAPGRCPLQPARPSRATRCSRAAR